MLRCLTAGESHGPGIVAVLEGLPSGLSISEDYINHELSRRQKGYGRGDRMRLEKDRVEVLSGLYNGMTIGSPICVLVKNRDAAMEQKPEVYCPRPGHADLAGGMKFEHKNMRYVLERSSARETVGRVLIGAFCKKFLQEFNVELFSHVVSIGKVSISDIPETCTEFKEKVESSPVHCCDERAQKEMVSEIDKAIKDKDSLGGVFEIIVYKPVPGIGSYIQWDEKLDGNLSRALMSIQAIKGVEIGKGFKYAREYGSRVHDEIFFNKEKHFYRKTNNAGGLEGGMTNGEEVIVRAVMKPIPTLTQPLQTVDIRDKKSQPALKERSDVCAVPAASIVGESVVAFEIAKAFREKFGGDSLGDAIKSFDAYIERIKNF